MDTEKFKVGDNVRWLDSPFTIELIKGEKALLRQKFSIGITLKELVPLKELIMD